MKLHIRELILWSADEGRKPVVITFPESRVSVITGWSETGKSAILSIIDYVLGSERCTIPIGVVRDAVVWYGLRIDTEIGLVRVARRKPDQTSSTDYEVLTHDDASRDSKIHPSRNRHLEQFKSLMDTLGGLSDLPTAPGELGKGYGGPASFRDMAAFNFLPQHIVANPFTMFYKTDTAEHREKLRRVFPLVLGTKSNEQLLLEHRRSPLESEEKKLGAEIRRRKASIETWRSQISGSYLRAQELDLVPAGEIPESMTACVSVLRRLSEDPASAIARAPAATTGEAVTRLERFRSQEDTLDHDLGDARRKLRQIKAIDASVTEYAGDLFRERDRVRGYDWFQEVTRGAHECPVCGTQQSSASTAIETLRESIEDLEKLATTSVVARPRLDSELLSLEKEIRSLEEQLFGIRRIRQELEVQSANPKSAGQRLEDVYFFIGGVRQALESMREIEDAEGIGERHRRLVQEIQAVSEQLEAARRRPQGRNPNDTVGDLIQEHAVLLGLGHSDLRPVLDLKELNLRFVPNDSKEIRGDFLWEIGSGANWMGYHLATMLALHEYFASRTENPVPNFLIVDQPSQVYFPSDTFEQLVERLEEGAKDEDTKDEDAITPSAEVPSPMNDRQSDLAKTRKIFELLANVQLRPTLNLQIIVLEHADERTWEGLDPIVTKVCDWRWSGEKLIPSEWLS